MTTRKRQLLEAAAASGDAVLYLRVSSEGQVNTDYNPEGISIPAQREAGHSRAREIGTAVLEEFIDPGKSAKSIEHRQAFAEMIAYLRANPNVRYVIVYALSRFARNRYDDAMMMVTLEKLGVRLVSATERNLDDTPAGKAMHGMIAVFNEYQVLVQGEDIKYKMGQKAKQGGTLGVAKFGYENIRVKHNGREIRTIAVDAERAPFVKMAFELYATGTYGFNDLRDALTDAGCRTRGNRRYGPRPISIHALGKMLRDRYYLGYVEYDGTEYPGRHEPLIDQELFDKVQKVLYGERGAGTRKRKHDHYLKGTIWCARCRRRLIYFPTTGKTGQEYVYYVCRGVQEGDCDLPSLPLAKVERVVIDHYVHAALPERHRHALERIAAEASTDSRDAIKTIQKALRRQLADLDAQENRLLDLLGDPDWPQDKLKLRMRDIREAKQRIEHQLENSHDNLDAGRDVLTAALELLANPRDFYDAATDDGRKLLNKAIFARLYLDAVGRQPRATTAALAEPVASLLHASQATDTTDQNGAPQGPWEAADDLTNHRAGLLAVCLQDQSLSKPAMVELRGLEPLTPSMPWPFSCPSRVSPPRSNLPILAGESMFPRSAPVRRAPSKSGWSADELRTNDLQETAWVGSRSDRGTTGRRNTRRSTATSRAGSGRPARTRRRSGRSASGTRPRTHCGQGRSATRHAVARRCGTTSRTAGSSTT
jgi:site-specific DNA recombinase